MLEDFFLSSVWPPAVARAKAGRREQQGKEEQEVKESATVCVFVLGKGEGRGQKKEVS